MLTALNILVSFMLICAVIGLLYWAATRIITLLPAAFQATATVVLQVVAAICVVYFLVGFIGWLPGFKPIRLWH